MGELRQVPSHLEYQAKKENSNDGQKLQDTCKKMEARLLLQGVCALGDGDIDVGCTHERLVLKNESRTFPAFQERLKPNGSVPESLTFRIGIRSLGLVCGGLTSDDWRASTSRHLSACGTDVRMDVDVTSPDPNSSCEQRHWAGMPRHRTVDGSLSEAPDSFESNGCHRRHTDGEKRRPQHKTTKRAPRHQCPVDSEEKLYRPLDVAIKMIKQQKNR